MTSCKTPYLFRHISVVGHGPSHARDDGYGGNPVTGLDGSDDSGAFQVQDAHQPVSQTHDHRSPGTIGGAMGPTQVGGVGISGRGGIGVHDGGRGTHELRAAGDFVGGNVGSSGT